MTFSKQTKAFLDSQIDYYISEAQSYRQIAENYVPEIESVIDTAFGIVVGSVYAVFLQSYTNQRQTPSLEDIKDFNRMLKERAPLIKKALMQTEVPNLG